MSKHQNWKNIKQIVFERDSYQCQICGDFEHKLIVHHVKPARFGGTDAIQNLIALCVTCHRPAELGKLGAISKHWLKVRGYDEKYFFQRIKQIGILTKHNSYQKKGWITFEEKEKEEKMNKHKISKNIKHRKTFYRNGGS